MCFNISITTHQNILEKEFNAKFETNLFFEPQKHISAFSNPLIPIITSDNKSKIQFNYWGLIPEWVQNINKANDLRKMTYNAKSETVNQKSSFRDSFRNKKCLVIVDGFYEWETTSSGKICHYITYPENEIFTFAGIWSNWLDKSTGELIKSVSILTQPANAMMSKIHNIKKRQPVIVDKKNQSDWFASDLDFQKILDKSFAVILKSKVIQSPLKNN